MPEAPELIEFILRTREQVVAEQVQKERTGKIKQKSRVDPKDGCVQNVGVKTLLKELMKGKYRKQGHYHRFERDRNMVHHILIKGHNLLNGNYQEKKPSHDGHYPEIPGFEKAVIKERNGQCFHNRVNVEQ